MGINNKGNCASLSHSLKILPGVPVGGDVPSTVPSELQYGKG